MTSELPDMQDFASQIIPRYESRPRGPLNLSYIIASSQRTGSTLLADALSATGIAGNPDEYFVAKRGAEQLLRQRFEIAHDADFIDRLIATTASDNGVFGIKLFWGHWNSLIRKLIAKTPSYDPTVPIERALPVLLQNGLGNTRYIWLRRRNKIAQAISLYRANNTGIWRAAPGRNDQDNVADRDLEFDYDEIHEYVNKTRDEDRRWNEYFRTYRITSLMIYYEDFVQNYEFTIRGVLKFLGLSYMDASVMSPLLERQADARSKEWEREYIICKQKHSPAAASMSNFTERSR